MEILFLWFLFSVVVGIVAACMRKSFIVGFFWSLIASPLIGFLIVLFINPSGKKCLYCAEYINKEAIVCRHCGKDVNESKSFVEKEISHRAIPNAKRYCPRCKKTYDNTWKQCWNCLIPLKEIEDTLEK